MNNENYITLAGYTKINEANEDASYLKEKGIDCKVITDEPAQAFFIPNNESEDWIFLIVPEDEFENAADLLDLDPLLIEDFEPYYGEKGRKDKRYSRGFWLWGGIFSVLIILRLLAEVV